MKNYLFIFLFCFLFSCNQDASIQDREFTRVWGKIHSTGRLTYITEDNVERLYLEIEDSNFDPNLLCFKIGQEGAVFFESVDYEFDTNRVAEMWLAGGGDCSGSHTFASKSFEAFGGIQKLKFEPESWLWDCVIGPQPIEVMPMEFEIFIRKAN